MKSRLGKLTAACVLRDLAQGVIGRAIQIQDPIYSMTETELVGAVTLGIAVADLLAYEVGTGIVQLAFAVAIARGNAKLLTEPVQLAPQRGFGEVSWRTPIEKSAFDVPIGEKADLLGAVAAALGEPTLERLQDAAVETLGRKVGDPLCGYRVYPVAAALSFVLMTTILVLVLLYLNRVDVEDVL